MFNMDHSIYTPLWHNGPRPGAFYDFPAQSSKCTTSAPGVFGSQRTSQPITTGTSVVGIKFDDGVIIAADTLISYGSLARFRDVDRVFKINENTIIGVGGDYADFQFIKRFIDQKVTEDYCFDDKLELKPKSLYNWLTRVLYNKRSRFDPLWIDVIVGGIQNGKPFLGHVDMRGRAYEDSHIATGYGKHLALPLLREEMDKSGAALDLNAAYELTKKSMEVLYYRDCRGHPQYKQVVCTSDSTRVEGPFNVSQNWHLANMIKGY